MLASYITRDSDKEDNVDDDNEEQNSLSLGFHTHGPTIEELSAGKSFPSQSSPRSCQTESFASREDYCQCPEVTSNEAQTEILSRQPSQDYSKSEIRAFLSYAVPITLQEIRESSNLNWESLFLLRPRLGAVGATLVHTFEHHSSLQGGSRDNDDNLDMINLDVSTISCNCTSTVLAIGHSMPVHDDWCSHESPIMFYNLLRRNQSGKPWRIEVDSCVSSLVAHPKLSSIFAVGCVSGKVLVVESTTSGDIFTRKDGAREGGKEDKHMTTHEDRVTSLLWIHEDASGANHLLISLAFDGRVFMWKYNTVRDRGQDLTLIQAFSVSIEDLHMSLSFQQHKHDRLSSASNKSPVGVSAACLVPREKKFVLGCIAGGLFLCSCEGRMGSKRPLSSSTGQDLPSPVIVSYVPHRSTLKSIHFSSVRRDIFLSCSVDEIRIYTFQDSKPLAILHLEGGIENALWTADQEVLLCRQSNGSLRSIKYVDNRDSVKNRKLQIQGLPPSLPSEAHLLGINPFESITQLLLVNDSGDIQVWSVRS